MGVPTGTVTLLFTDIQGSTVLWENHPEQMRTALARHDALMRAAIENNNGWVFKTIGDAFCAAFATAPEGVAAALEAQQWLQAEAWEAPLQIRVRMGLHTGAVEHRDNDYFGPPLNRAARLMSVGHGGQVLVSAATQELVRDQMPGQATLRDMGPHRLKDLGRPEEIFQLLHPDLAADFLPLRSLNNPQLPNNLPQQVTSFIGRDRELAEIKRLLHSTRMLTITAAGGTGKSRLSLQAAADMLDEFPDGVWLVELAGLKEPALIAQTVAQQLNIAETAGEPLLQTLTGALKAKRLMLILDNCEHLIAACAELTGAILRNCSGITILASSREAMNVTGEVTFPLAPLSLPDPKKKHTSASLSQYEAVHLFIDRAAAVRPDFAVTNLNAAALAQLCHRLDGIPLALELAAARVRVLSVEEINSRLDNRFRLLTGGSRNVLPRQQTLRALIDWSYDLLNDQEKTLLARISIFAGGWTLEAAEQVCAGEGVEDWEIFDLLSALTDKSLVVSDAESAQVRFRLLETLREYSREKLHDASETETVAELHARYFADRVKRTSDSETDESDFGWMLAEADNIRAALEWLWQSNRVQDAAGLSVNLYDFWTHSGNLREAYGNLIRAAEQTDVMADPRLGALTRQHAAWFAFLLGDLETAKRLADSSVIKCLEAGAAETQGNATNILALIAQTLNDYERAEALYLQAIVIFRSLKREGHLANSLMNLGFLQSSRGRHDSAQELFSEAKLIYERRSDPSGMAAWLCNQSDLALRQSNWTAAQSFAQQSVDLCRRIQHRHVFPYALTNLAQAALKQKEYSVTDTAVREAVAICAETNLRDLLPVLFITQARSYMAQGNQENTAALLAGAGRIRALIDTPADPEEIASAALLETELRENQAGDLLDSARSQYTASGLEELIARMPVSV